MARREYSPETKAAVMAALLTGQAISQVAKEYDIPIGTVKTWKARHAGASEVDPEKKVEIGDLLIAYLEQSLRSLKIQVDHFGNTDWLISQDADNLAVLHGVQTDKAIRLLEALAKEEETE